MAIKSDLSSTISTLGASTATDEEQYALATPLVLQNVDAESLYVDQPVKTLDAKYAKLAKLRQELKWNDKFFDEEGNDDDVIAVFDFDYDNMETFYTSMGWASLASTCLYTPLFVASLVGLVPCYLRKNVEWSTRSKHVAITQDGIRFVQERRPCCWGLPCTDRGKSSKTVPFDKITDCDIEEPAGNSCLCIPNILSTVNVDTASSGTEGRKELKLAGLKDPHSFKKLVWAMKRSQQGTAPVPANMTRDGGDVGGSGDEVALLLREIRDELRVNNQLLQKPTTQQDQILTQRHNARVSKDTDQL